MKTSANIPIDEKALRACLEVSGHTLADASRAMGFAGTYLNQVCARGTITEAGAKLIDSCLAIPLKLYAKKEPTPEPEWTQDEPADDPLCEMLPELREIKALLEELVGMLK